MLTPKDLLLLREALELWVRATHGFDGIYDSDHVEPEQPIDVTQDDVNRLLDHLRLENVRYIVVDSNSNHTVNTRLFRTMPKIHPSTDRWQVRIVLG